jgi:hypothetical protein
MNILKKKYKNNTPHTRCNEEHFENTTKLDPIRQVKLETPQPDPFLAPSLKLLGQS